MPRDHYGEEATAHLMAITQRAADLLPDCEWTHLFDHVLEPMITDRDPIHEMIAAVQEHIDRFEKTGQGRGQCGDRHRYSTAGPNMFSIWDMADAIESGDPHRSSTAGRNMFSIWDMADAFESGEVLGDGYGRSGALPGRRDNGARRGGRGTTISFHCPQSQYYKAMGPPHRRRELQDHAPRSDSRCCNAGYGHNTYDDEEDEFEELEYGGRGGGHERRRTGGGCADSGRDGGRRD